MFSRAGWRRSPDGKPSEAFGAPYAPFDTGRFIARLPSPPYLCMDRVVRMGNAPWVLAPGEWTEAELDVAAGCLVRGRGAHGARPLLHPARGGPAALRLAGGLDGLGPEEPKPLHFRNLGGKAVQHRDAPAGIGTLRTRVRLTQVSEVPDMLIQHFDFEVHGREGLIYGGSTYFGFFTPEALGRQEGLRPDPAMSAGPHRTGRAERPWCCRRPTAPPADAARRRRRGCGCRPGRCACSTAWRSFPHGGPHRSRPAARGEGVDPDEWFFKAHFFQDPVWPGSLGLEAFLQLLKAAALHLRPELAGDPSFRPGPRPRARAGPTAARFCRPTAR